MSRYADIEPIIKKIKYSMEIGEIRGRIWFEMVLKDLEELPEADAVPVKHGHWIGKPLAGYSTVKCSACGSAFVENNGKWKYCPDCGSKMDEVEK